MGAYTPSISVNCTVQEKVVGCPSSLASCSYRQLNAIHRVLRRLRPSRPDKARRPGYKARQRYVTIVRVGCGISPAARSPPSSTPPTSTPTPTRLPLPLRNLLPLCQWRPTGLLPFVICPH
ncbi:hypothetical protein BJV78DRAFT_1184754 [Lactifluus subvellereus]|nr:hypothetical protein BJV78DRAFT_1184754 [Lactifluus subvellereus]